MPRRPLPDSEGKRIEITGKQNQPQLSNRNKKARVKGVYIFKL